MSDDTKLFITPNEAAITERLPDSHRQLIVVLVTEAWSRIRSDPEMTTQRRECEAIIRRLSGTDTRLVVERAYASGVEP